MRNILYVLSLVGQLGFIIAIPAALFGFGGAMLDRQLHTSPLFILVGLGMAITASSFWVYRFVKHIK
jgi:F0F1-type ATP synthase assembly protein I